MNTPQGATLSKGAEQASAPLFVGTLQYTRAGLAAVAVWLLVGVLGLNLATTLPAMNLPFMLHDLGASKTTMALFASTIPSIIGAIFGFVLGPVIGFWSDRLRSRWGRRIPFIAVPAGLVTLCLLALAFAPQLGAFLTGAICMLLHLSTGIIWGVLFYLFYDVVPYRFMGRFLALFAMVGPLFGFAFHYFLYNIVRVRMQTMFLGAAVVYLAGFLLMCRQVKEGEYPPPPKNLGGRKGFFAAVETFAVECMSHRFYWYLYLSWAFLGLAGAGRQFENLRLQSFGLTLQQIGRLNGWVLGITAIPALVLAYPAGMLADRCRQFRTLLGVQIATLIVAPLGLILLFAGSSSRALYVILIALAVIQMPLMLLHRAISMPLNMRLLPRERFGQFSAFSGLVLIASGYLFRPMAGWLMALMHWLFPDARYGADFYLRFLPLWETLAAAAGLVFLLLLYREYRELGGEEAFRPPELDNIMYAEAGASGMQPDRMPARHER